jgi:DNA-directed RNA polymerase specialized sigma24 family protein
MQERAVTREDFEKVYEASYTKALNAARRIAWEHAEDAVADAAVYLTENLERFQTITSSYFIQKCVNRARDIRRNQHPETMHYVGLESELSLQEEKELERQLGRAFTPGKRND